MKAFIGSKQRLLAAMLVVLAIGQVSLTAQRLGRPEETVPGATGKVRRGQSDSSSTSEASSRAAHSPSRGTASTAIPRVTLGKPWVKGKIPFSIMVTPTCGEIADRMQAVIKTLPGTYLTLTVIDPDGNNYDRYTISEVGSSGRLLYTWVVRPDATTGRGYVLAAGVGPDRKRGAEGKAPFLVAAPNACP